MAIHKPVWGWRDDTPQIVEQQIDCCADHGIAFWAFDWYYPEGKDKATPLNSALQLYLKAPNSNRLQFCLLVANHAGFRIGPKDWDACCEKWIELFRQPTHLCLDGRPGSRPQAHSGPKSNCVRLAQGSCWALHQCLRVDTIHRNPPCPKERCHETP